MASRTKRLYIRISNHEYADICRNAKNAGLNLSQYGRKLLIGEVVKPAKHVDLYKLYNEINKIGININQIAKMANSTKTIEQYSIKQVIYLLTKIYDLVDEGVS